MRALVVRVAPGRQPHRRLALTRVSCCLWEGQCSKEQLPPPSPAPGVMEQFIADNTDMIVASGHVLESTMSQVFLAG